MQRAVLKTVLSHHKVEGLLLSVVFQRSEQSLLHSHLLFPHQRAESTASEPAILPPGSLESKTTAHWGWQGLLMRGSCHVGFLFSFWFILRAPNISQWWSRTPGYLFCRQPQHIFHQAVTVLCCKTMLETLMLLWIFNITEDPMQSIGLLKV